MIKESIQDICAGIKTGRFANEAAVQQGIILRLLQDLGWPTWDTRVVAPEFSMEGRRVDYALCNPADKPIIFIEVKQVGQSDGNERQLFEYAFHHGVPMAILTDGQQWHFFLPAEQGSYGERRVYKLDIVERDIAETISRLERYLSYAEVRCGNAINFARADYRNVARDREIRDSLPKAWRLLISEEDDLLLELISDRAESLCGYRPDMDQVAVFLKQIDNSPPPSHERDSISRSRNSTPGAPKPIGAILDKADFSPANLASGGRVGIDIEGNFIPAKNAKDALIKFFQAVQQRDITFYNRFASLPKHGRSRRYLTRDKMELFPNRPDLVNEYSVELSPGWWLGTNQSKESITKVIRMACDVIKLKFGQQVKINLGD